MKIHLRKRASTSLNPQVRRLVVSSPARANGTFWRRNLLCLAGVIFVLAASVGLGWSRWLAVKDIPPLPPARPIERWQNSPWDGSVPIVKDHFLRYAHDPVAMEFVEWSPVYTSPNGSHEVRVVVRSKNPFGATIRKQFFVKYTDSAVSSTTPPF
jgi:hypothetical protein